MPPEREPLPREKLASGIAAVATRVDGKVRHVTVRLARPAIAVPAGWQTGVALDASASMRGVYGHPSTGTTGEGAADPPRFVVNDMEPLARGFVAHLAETLDADGGTTVIYWACGPDGTDIEVVGDFPAEAGRQLTLAGPTQKGFGTGTRLTPALNYFIDRFETAPLGLFVFLTDGRLEDLSEVSATTIRLARAISAGARNPVKCVLVGLGPKVDAEQLQALDNLDTGTGVDVWDHKLATDWSGVPAVLEAVVADARLVAPVGSVMTPDGEIIRAFPAGLPVAFGITVPTAAAYIDIKMGTERVRQPLG